MERFKDWKQPEFYHIIGDLYKTIYDWKVTCPNELFLDRNTDIGTGTYINARYGVEIHEGVQIGANCSIYSEDTERGINGKIIITKGVRIGANAVILPRKDMIHYIIKDIKAGSVVF